MSRARVILHVTAPGAVGGLERVVHALAAGHARRGHQVHVAAITDSATAADAFFGSLASRGVHTHAIVAPSRAYRRERSEVRALCARIAPDVVHTHGYRADVLSSGVARALGIPTVTTVHGFTGGDLKNRVYEWLQVMAFRRFDAVVAVSSQMADVLARRGIRRERLVTIVNAWNPGGAASTREAARARLGLPASGRSIGWVGRLSWEKGADLMLEAIAVQPGGDAVVSMIGEGRERSALDELARRQGIAHRVIFHGQLPDAASLMAAFDVFALSSRTEGTPIVLFEAMAARVPVVAFDVGGVPNVVGPEDAFLVPAGNCRALADALTRALDDPAEASRRAARAQQRLAERFALEPWLASYERLYESVTPTTAPPRASTHASADGVDGSGSRH